MTTHRKLWGRSQSHPLSSLQKEFLEKGLASFHFDPAGDFVPDILEIGFGDGEHLIGNIIAQQDKHFLGCEPFINGNVNVLKAIEEHHLNNTRVYVDDVHLVLDSLGEGSLERIYVLFPDPWPKKRHQKRRILNRAFMSVLASKLKQGGELMMASDDPAYQEFIQEEAHVVPTLAYVSTQTPPYTKYARKAERAGRTSYLYIFKKV